MDWTGIKAGLKPIVASMAGLSSPGAVEWQDDPGAANYRPNVRVTLFARSIVTRGQDGKRISRNDANTADVATIVGARSFTLVVKVESDDAVTEDAKIYADRVRTRMRRDSTIKALRAMNISLVAVQSTVDQTLVTGGRKLSVCVTDILLNAGENDVDDTASPNPADTIESAHIVGNKLQDEAGHDVAPQPDITVTKDETP